jgi:hypothetical protein
MAEMQMTNNQDTWMSLALKREVEIERLLNAIKRIDGINDNPADFNVAIDEVCSTILRPR